MPDFDGSIVINTEIDATGIQRDMKKVERAARGAGDATESIGSGFRTAERDADRAASGIQGGTRKVERAARSAGSEVEDIGSSFRDAERDAGRAARGIEDDLKDLKDSVDDVSNAISLGFGADMLVDLAGGMMDLMESTDELRGDLSMLDQNARAAGVGLGTTREAMQKLNTVSGETDSSIEAVSNLLAAGVPENRLQEAVEGLANAAITFPDTVKIESLADSLQETLATGEATGQFAEVLDRIGYGAENFTNNLAMCTTEAEKQELALNVLTQGPLKGVYDAWAKANPELVEGRDATLELQTATAELGTALAPVITDLTELATNVVNWVAGMGNIDDVFTMIVGGIAALGAIKAIDMITGLATSLMTMDKAMLMAKASTGLAFVAFGVPVSVIVGCGRSCDHRRNCRHDDGDQFCGEAGKPNERRHPAELESKHIRRSLRPQRQHTRAGYRCSDPAEWGVPGGTGRPEEGPQPGGPGKPYPANCEGRERRRIERNPDHTSGAWTNPLPGL